MSYLATKIRDVSNVVSGGTPDTSNPNYWDGEINWFTPSEIGNSKYVENSKRRITSLGYKNCGAKLMSPGSILLSSRATVGDASISKTECCTNQGFQSLTDFKCCGQYLYYYLQTYRIHKSLIRRASGSTFLEISNYEVGNTDIFIPDLNIQEKIAIFLSKIDDRIETQNKIIEELKTLKAVISNLIFKALKCENIIIEKLCSITTGKLDANAGNPNGKYRFYTCAEEYSFIDNYSFDCEAILISGNGANVGYVHQYSGKFNAYQRTYVLYDFKGISPTYLKYYLEVFLKQRINAEKNTGNTPYIRLNTIAKMAIKKPDKTTQEKIVSVLDKISEKLSIEIRKIDLFKKQKSYFLSNLFI